MPDRWKAIVLAAGRGRRLGDSTNHCPKPLIQVGGVSILERALCNLARQGCEEAVLIVGYRAADVRRQVGTSFGPMQITYVENPCFDETNTAYSLWLARGFLQDNCLLLEGDLVFEDAALQRILRLDGNSVWAGVSVAPGRDEGILLETDGGGRVVRCQLVRHAVGRQPSLRYKCAGIQKLSAGLAERLRAELNGVMQAGERRIYADLVLGRLLYRDHVHLCLLDDLKWAEVDDAHDLHSARSIFRDPVVERGSPILQEQEAWL